MLRRALLAGFLLLAAGAPRAEPPPPATAEGLLSFADSLLAAGESYRAATEYLRFLHHFTGSPAAPAAWAGLGKASAQAGRWDEAAAAFRQLSAVSPSPESRRLLGAALYRGGRHGEAARVLLDPGGDGGDAALGTLALLRGGPLVSVPPGAREDLAAEYASLPRKSPAFAGGLSAVLPGAGHLYCDRPRDALVSLLLNASFLWATVAAAERDQWALAGVLGFFELGWYSGSVVSSVNAAHKWNRREERRFFERHEPGLVPAWSLAPLREGAGVRISWAWW